MNARGDEIPDWRLARMYEMLADSVEEMTDEQILAEAVERGEDPAATSLRVKALLRRAADIEE